MHSEAANLQCVACSRSAMAEQYRYGMGDLAGVEPLLAAALRDVLSAPGSLTRSIVACHLSEAMGLDSHIGCGLACGVEYLHTASLIFDDLPAMDDASMRRGVPCVHRVHGESVAILTALALINKAYTYIWRAAGKSITEEKYEKAATLIEKSLGLYGLVGGQALDVKGWSDQQNPRDVLEVAKQKTSSLLYLSMVLPAVIGHGTPREVQLLERLALFRGLSFQAVDDLKDVLVAEGDSGKTAGRDEIKGRPNLIVAEGFQSGLERFRKMLRIGDTIQSRLPGDPSRWKMLSMLRVTLPMTAKIITLTPP